MKTEVSKKYEEVWDGTKKGMETINSGERVKYGKDLKEKLGSSLMVT